MFATEYSFPSFEIKEKRKENEIMELQTVLGFAWKKAKAITAVTWVLFVTKLRKKKTKT